MNNAILFEEDGICVFASYKRYAGKARQFKLCFDIAKPKNRADATQAMLNNQTNRKLRLHRRKQMRASEGKKLQLTRSGPLPGYSKLTLGRAPLAALHPIILSIK